MRASSEIAVAPKHATATRAARSAASVKTEHCRAVGGANVGDSGWGRWWGGGRAGACLEEGVIALVYLSVQRVARADQLTHCHLENRLPRLQQRKLPKHPADLLVRRL